jgi:hypothetical protein
MLMQNVEQRLFLLFWIGSYFMVKYMSIVIINKQKDNPMNNSMCHFAIAISIGDGGGNAIRRMPNRNGVTTVNRMLSLTNLSMVLSCSGVALFSSAMAVIYQLLC